MNSIYSILAICFIIINPMFGQTNSLENLVRTNFKNYPILEKTVDIFDGDSGMLVISENNSYYKIKLGDSGKIISKGRINIYIYHDTTVMVGDSIYNQINTSRFTIQHVFKTWYHGDYFEYFDNRLIKVKGRYKWGLRNGVWKFYDINGKLIKKEKWKLEVRIK